MAHWEASEAAPGGCVRIDENRDRGVLSRVFRAVDWQGAGVRGVWRSLVAHLLWEQGVGGSNPSTPTNVGESGRLA